jgi:hypothetical protein
MIEAVKDALGSDLKITNIHTEGKGEDPAVRNGLKDPESLGMTRVQFRAKYPNQVAQWPDWRKVDLLIEGRLLIRIKAGQ